MKVHCNNQFKHTIKNTSQSPIHMVTSFTVTLGVECLHMWQREYCYEQCSSTVHYTVDCVPICKDISALQIFSINSRLQIFRVVKYFQDSGIYVTYLACVWPIVTRLLQLDRYVLRARAGFEKAFTAHCALPLDSAQRALSPYSSRLA